MYFQSECRACFKYNSSPFLLTVDTTPPTVTNCPLDQTIEIEFGVESDGQATWTLPIATDLSGVANLISSPPTLPARFPLGTTTIMYIYQDASGNINSDCSFTITVTAGTYFKHRIFHYSFLYSFSQGTVVFEYHLKT